MKTSDLEKWVFEIIRKVRLGQRLEDSHVECKAAWIEPKLVARKIAGHANAAYGHEILWLFGIDEKASSVCGVSDQELANWIPQLNKEFGGNGPGLIMDLNVSHESAVVVALLFDTTDAPYVTKVPDTDRLEVPWREGTRTKSAGRVELIRMFSALQASGKLVDSLVKDTPTAMALAFEKPPNWQLSLLAELLRTNAVIFKRRREESESGFYFQKSIVLSKQEFVNLVAAKATDLHQLINIIAGILQKQLPSYSEMDAVDIKSLVTRLMENCNHLSAFEREMQCIKPPVLKEEYASAIRGLVCVPEAIDMLINEIEQAIQKSERLILPEKPLFIFPVVRQEKFIGFIDTLLKTMEALKSPLPQKVEKKPAQ